MNQLISEYSLNRFIYEARKEICNINHQKEEDRDLRSLQIKLRTVRNDLLNFISSQTYWHW
jgi:hypothetical protein